MVMKDRWQYGKRDANWVAKILKKFDLHRGKVLELGCGNGRVCIPLAKKGYEVTGVDMDKLGIPVKLMIYPKLGHAAPPGGEITKAFKWLQK